MILAKKLWNNVLDYLSRNYQFNEQLKQDQRFAFAIYWFMIHKDTLDSDKGTRVTLFNDYKKLFKGFDNCSYTAFERAIYRKFDEYRKENEIMLIDLVNNIRDTL